MRLLFVLFVLLSVQVNAQLVADNTRGLDSYFEGWLAESTKSAKSGKARGKIQREVVSLFKTAVNGPEESAGEEERLARVVYPSENTAWFLPALDIRWLTAYRKLVRLFPGGLKTILTTGRYTIRSPIRMLFRNDRSIRFPSTPKNIV